MVTKLLTKWTGALALTLVFVAAGVGSSIALAQSNGAPRPDVAPRAIVAVCRKTGTQWVKLRLASKQLRKSDLPVSGSSCPTPTRTVLCHLVAGKYTAVLVSLRLERKRLSSGYKRPTFGVCPKVKALVITPPPPATTTTLQPVTTVSAAPTTVLPVGGGGGGGGGGGAAATPAAAAPAPATTTTTTTTTAPVVAGPLTATAVAPLDYTFATATDTVSATITGGTAPYTVTLDVNGAATTLVPTVTGSTYSFAWDTTLVTEGAYTVNIAVTDSVGATATTAIRHVTVDHTPPTTFVIAPIAQTYFIGSMPVQAHADDLNGILTVQYDIDGLPAGAPLLTPDTVGTYTYSTTLPLTGLVNGVHTLTVVATDRAGLTTTSAPVSFGIGLQPLAATITSPNNLAFGHGTTPVTAVILGGTGPFSLQLLVDGVASGSPVTAAPYTLSWNTAGLADGQHSIAVQVTDSLGATATSPAFLELVDNTPPAGVMYQPTALPGYTYDITDGPTTFQVNASDANGVKSVQFTVDGTPVGPVLTAPDAPGTFLYTTTIDTSTLTPGSHTISALITDNAGNTGSANGLSLHSGPITYVPVLNYHGITGPLDQTPDEYDQTPAEAAQQLAYLQTNGYQSINLEQYQTWLTTGALPAGITKPVLITIDDGLTDELAWDPLLQQYGFTAVLFEVTGFADNTTPGANDPTVNLSWAQVQALAATGRWEIAFHAGEYGHADFSAASTTIDLGGGQTQSYESTCWTYYTCLGDITTTGGATPVTAQETPAQFESQIEAEITAGIAELKTEVPSASLVAWACPWNACGQWTTQYNDASNTIQSWLPGYAASQFPIVFTQTDPMQYGNATGQVGSITGDNRHYRFEVLTTTTIDQFAAALTDLAFAAR